MTDEPDDQFERRRETSDGEIEIDVESEDRPTDRDRRASHSHDRTTRHEHDVSDRQPSDASGDSQRDWADSRSQATRRSQPTESNLADELGRIDIMTTPEGYIEGRITDITAIDKTTVQLIATLPHGERVSFTLDKPIPWSEEFLLARLVEDVGYDAASIDHIVGEPVYLKRLSDDHDTGWWESSVHTVGDAVVSTISGGRYRLDHEGAPRWRLVDPLERPEPTTNDPDRARTTTAVGSLLIFFGTLIATIGAVVAATGGLVVSSGVITAALLGLVVVTIGLGLVLR